MKTSILILCIFAVVCFMAPNLMGCAASVQTPAVAEAPEFVEFTYTDVAPAPKAEHPVLSNRLSRNTLFSCSPKGQKNLSCEQALKLSLR